MPACKLDEDIEELLFDALSAMVPIYKACWAVGISYDTFKRWMRRGRAEELTNPDGKYACFAERMEMARARAEIAALEILDEAAKTDWRAAAWLLERHCPEQWGDISGDAYDDLPDGGHSVTYIHEYQSMACDAEGNVREMGRDEALAKPGTRRPRFAAEPPAKWIRHKPVVWGPDRPWNPIDSPCLTQEEWEEKRGHTVPIPDFMHPYYEKQYPRVVEMQRRWRREMEGQDQDTEAGPCPYDAPGPS